VTWKDDELFSVYSDDERILAQAIRTSREGWDAFDMTKLNAGKRRHFSIGHFKSREEAKKGVESYWADVKKGDGNETGGTK